jgi:ABC-2 type transport system ATP-binding protein
MSKLYSAFYKDFDYNIFKKRCDMLKLSQNGRLSAFSKGMKRQVSMLASLSCKTKYKFFDETFDGLDPVVRNLIKRFIYEEVAENNNTVILTSHNLRELEDICDHLGVLYKGGILFQGDINSIKTNIFKVQIGFREAFDKDRFSEFEVLNFKKAGSVATVIIKGEKEETAVKLQKLNPLILDILPLTLEEIFIYEMEVLGYAFNEINI